VWGRERGAVGLGRGGRGERDGWREGGGGGTGRRRRGVWE